MKEIQGDIWQSKADYICITTNGIVKKDGCLVMGAGIAKEAADRFPELSFDLGDLVSIGGNHVYATNYFYGIEFGKVYSGKYCIPIPEDTLDNGRILSFPTKHHFKAKSDLKLIKQSCTELRRVVGTFGSKTIAIPRPGCGCGGLDWKDVKPVLEQYFPEDNFWIYSK